MTKPTDLESLLKSLFDDQELRRFLRKKLEAGDLIADALPCGTVSKEELAHQAEKLLKRLGRIDRPLFSALLAERKGRDDDVRSVAGEYGIHDLPQEDVPSQESPHSNPPSDEADSAALALSSLSLGLAGRTQSVPRAEILGGGNGHGNNEPNNDPMLYLAAGRGQTIPIRPPASPNVLPQESPKRWGRSAMLIGPGVLTLIAFLVSTLVASNPIPARESVEYWNGFRVGQDQYQSDTFDQSVLQSWQSCRSAGYYAGLLEAWSGDSGRKRLDAEKEMWLKPFFLSLTSCSRSSPCGSIESRALVLQSIESTFKFRAIQCQPNPMEKTP